MILKYFIYVKERPIALKYNPRIGRCVVGGNPEALFEMQSIVRDYFCRKNVPRHRFFARNKVRMEFDLSSNKFTEGLRFLQENSIHITQCKSHYRLMR